ncbi:MAG: hypothetical protein JWO58_511 [Chitinophagaceae bacterium]|nr:hypothetical protein [Chitinophagaceae bacterium]
MRKKIGVLAQYLNTRHDIREFIEHLGQKHEVVIYVRKNDVSFTTGLASHVEVRMIEAQVYKNVWNNILLLLYRVFGVLPKSKHNYFITEYFKLNNAKLSRFVRIKESLLLNLSMWVPRWISYDSFLKKLNYRSDTHISDIDEFLCFTQIYDDLFFAHLLDSGKKVTVYVYSWDHPCKMKTFSKRVNEYLVWNAGLKEDLISLQSIDARQISILGSTQLTYIYDFLKGQERPSYYAFDYLYFACATGYPKLVRQEVSIIVQTAQYLAKNYPDLKLVVRTYPFFGAEDSYAPLMTLANVIIDDYKSRFKSPQDALLIIQDKLVKMSHAKGVIHFGTTFGLEASYFNAPVILADVVNQYKELHQFVHQYQNDKYLNLKYKNIPKDWTSYEQSIAGVIANHADMKLYNETVASTTVLYSLNDLVERV